MIGLDNKLLKGSGIKRKSTHRRIASGDLTVEDTSSKVDFNVNNDVLLAQDLTAPGGRVVRHGEGSSSRLPEPNVQSCNIAVIASAALQSGASSVNALVLKAK